MVIIGVNDEARPIVKRGIGSILPPALLAARFFVLSKYNCDTFSSCAWFFLLPAILRSYSGGPTTAATASSPASYSHSCPPHSSSRLFPTSTSLFRMPRITTLSYFDSHQHPLPPTLGSLLCTCLSIVAPPEIRSYLPSCMSSFLFSAGQARRTVPP